MDVGRGGSTLDRGAEGKVGDAGTIEVTSKPLSFGGIGVYGDIHAAAVVETHGSVEGGIAAGTYWQVSGKRRFEFLLNLAEAGGGESAGERFLLAALERGGLFRFQLALLFGTGHFGKFVPEAGLGFGEFESLAPMLELFLHRCQRQTGYHACFDQFALRVDTHLLLRDEVPGAIEHLAGEWLGKFLDLERTKQRAAQKGVLFSFLQGKACFFEAIAGQAATGDEFFDAFELRPRSGDFDGVNGSGG